MNNADILDKPLCLLLNKHWQPIAHRTVKQSLICLNGGSGELAPALAMDIGYNQLPDGSWDFNNPSYINPVKWDDWVKLPVREFDFSISTAKMTIRVPTVIISTNYAKMPLKTPRVSRAAIYERDAGKCQYTGKFVGREHGNLDHIVPRDRGGRDSFENLVWSAKDINSHKANRLPHEAGLRLLRAPKAPLGVPMSATFREAKHTDWRHFLIAGG